MISTQWAPSLTQASTTGVPSLAYGPAQAITTFACLTTLSMEAWSVASATRIGTSCSTRRLLNTAFTWDRGCVGQHEGVQEGSYTDA